MPIVFIHGVNTRKEDPGYAAREQLVLRFLRDHIVGASVGGKTVNALPTAFPYWGDLGTTFAWDMASVPPMSGTQALGSVDDTIRAVVAALQDRLGTLSGNEEALTAVAKQSLIEAVEILSDLVLNAAPASDAALVAAFVADMQSYAATNPHAPWVQEIVTDAQLIGQLINAVAGTSTINSMGNPFSKIGGWLNAASAKVKDAVRKAVGTAIDRAGDYASTKTLGWARRPLNATLGRFFGDVFVYMDQRGTVAAPGAIPKRILDAVTALPSARSEPLIVIGHSLGGVICYDLFSYFAPQIQVDLFVTVGSQVSHFEEMKRFKISNPQVPTNGVPRVACPPNILRWINIFDPVDIFAYQCVPVFDGVTDYEYDTKTFTVKAHGAYFDQKRFYERVRDRIDHLP